ncbi:MAG: hypothetical protein P4L79_12835 [Legionella sp.]|uniref:hypothetical protein n=1 Tax=Legionella sp. TaxID=459 RepID=UPI002844564F|nr:hypothetical protein [Legionella sp.]
MTNETIIPLESTSNHVECTNGRVYSDADKIYFRGDSRPPATIFKYGFTPRRMTNDPEWYFNAIESVNSKDNLGNENPGSRACTGINQDKAVCFTSHPHVAPFFPTRTATNEYSYVYIVALPPETKIEYAGTDGSMRIETHNLNPQQIAGMTVDTHSLQTIQTDNITREISKDNIGAGFGLWAYEAMAQQVQTENIIGAILCKRLSEFQDAYTPIEFIYEGELIKNPNFGKVHATNVQDEEPLETIKKHYQEQVKSAERIIGELKNKPLKTPDAEYGFGGKTLSIETLTHDNARIQVHNIINNRVPSVDAAHIMSIIFERDNINFYGDTNFSRQSESLLVKFVQRVQQLAPPPKEKEKTSNEEKFHTDGVKFTKDQEKFKRECYLVNQIHNYFVERMKQAKSHQEVADLRKFHEEAIGILFNSQKTNKQIVQLKELAHTIFSPDDKVFSFLKNRTETHIAQGIYSTLGIFSQTAQSISKRIDETPDETLERGAGNKK